MPLGWQILHFQPFFLNLDSMQVPAELGDAPALAWMSLASNPACGQPPSERPPIAAIAPSEVALGERLGDGASGDVFAGTWQVVSSHFSPSSPSDQIITSSEVPVCSPPHCCHCTFGGGAGGTAGGWGQRGRFRRNLAGACTSTGTSVHQVNRQQLTVAGMQGRARQQSLSAALSVSSASIPATVSCYLMASFTWTCACMMSAMRSLEAQQLCSSPRLLRQNLHTAAICHIGIDTWLDANDMTSHCSCKGGRSRSVGHMGS